MSNNICPICINNYTNHKYKKIICYLCNYECCCECIKNYIIHSTSDPTCMNCHELFTIQFLLVNLPRTFIMNEYKLLKTNILFKFELSLLPETIPIVGYINKRDKYMNFLYKYKKQVGLKDIIDEIDTLTQNIVNVELNLFTRVDKDKIINIIINNEEIGNPTNFINIDISDQYTKYFNRLQELKYKHLHIRSIIRTIGEEIIQLDQLISNNTINKTIKYTYIQNCANEDCKGSITDDYKCQVCDLTTCSKCNIIILNNHKCNPDDIATNQLIQNTSKPCPNCNILLFKIGGCDQFFCTICYTPFNWNTGEIIKNQFFHNPHYMEMLTNGSITNETVFGNINNNTDIRNLYINIINKISNWRQHKQLHRIKSSINSNIYLEYKNITDITIYNISSYIIPMMGRIIRMYGHIKGVELMVYKNDYLLNNRGLRIKYLMNNINEDEFKTEIYKKYYKNEKNLEIYNILNSFVLISETIFLNLVEIPNITQELSNEEIIIYFKPIQNYINQFDILKNKINVDLTNICKIYKIKNRNILEDWSNFTYI